MTSSEIVVLSRWQRKARLRHGEVKQIAAEVKKHASFVSQVLNDRRRHPVIEAAIARHLQLAPNERAFPPLSDAEVDSDDRHPMGQAA